MRNTDDRRSHSPATRRNGTLQSCEPCRRSKQRCDHERPVCRRCASKRMSEKCFYHPAPMTRRRSMQHTASLPPPSRLAAGQPTSNASSPGSLGGSRIFATAEQPSALPGYLGSTSFTAVLTEHRDEIPFEPEENTDSYPVLSVEPERAQSGADVLLFLYNLTVRQKLIDKFYSRSWNAVVPKIVLDVILTSVQEIFNGLNPNDPMPQLRNLATQIFQNSSRAMTAHQSMTVTEYCASFTGRNLRWEALGNIFSVCGQQLVITPDNDPEISEDSRVKDRLLEQVLQASTICLNFCDQASSANELLAYLQYNDVMLRTQQYGDSSYQAWRRLGDLVATIYAAGIHLDTDSTETYPFFLRQWRRGAFISAFYMDKMMATFVGRPPLMNHRYCTLVPPLDLSDDVLVAGEEALDQALAELDSNGWDTKGVRHRMSPSRVRFHLAVAREQTLDIALGTPEIHDQALIRKANEIEENVRIMWAATPDHLRYDRMPVNDYHHGWLTIVYIYLNYLYSCFLLQRALIKHTNTSREALCDVSRRALSIVVITITSQRHSMVDLDKHYSWIALTYGLPSASVLLIELLHQSHEPGPHTVAIPRAEVIRNISVFIQLLSWVSRPGHGNYRACKEAEKKLSRILDQLLDPQPVQADMVHDVTSGLSSFLDWSNYNSWDFNTEYFPSADGFAPL